MNPKKIIEESLKNLNACCGGAVASAIGCLKNLGASKGEMLAYRSSYDVRPDDSFVGYVGIIFS